MLSFPFEEFDGEIASCRFYMYRNDATTLNIDELDDHQIVQFYNRRTEVIETSLTAFEASKRQ